MIEATPEPVLPSALLMALRSQGYSGPEELNPPVSTGWTPLTFATSIGALDLTRELLELGADPNLPCTEEGRPALFYATFSGKNQRGLVNELISFGADVRYVDPRGFTPATFALAHHEGPLVALLLSLGGFLEGTPGSHDERIFEVIDQAVEGLIVLLRQGVSPSLVDYQGNNMLHALAHSLSFACMPPAPSIRLLNSVLAHGVNPTEKNYQGDTPLHVASRSSHRLMSQWLCGQAIEIDARNDTGATPLTVAAMHCHRIALGLLNKGADPLVINRAGMDVLMASFSRFSSPTEMVSFTIGAAKGSIAGLQSSASHRVGWCNETGRLSSHFIPNVLSEKLLSMGASPKTIARNGATALMRAARFQPEMVSLLISAGADVNARDRSGWTAMMCAAASHRAELALEPLLKAGAHWSQAEEKKEVARLWSFNPRAKALLDATMLSSTQAAGSTGSSRRL